MKELIPNDGPVPPAFRQVPIFVGGDNRLMCKSLVLVAPSDLDMYSLLTEHIDERVRPFAMGGFFAYEREYYKHCIFNELRRII